MSQRVLLPLLAGLALAALGAPGFASAASLHFAPPIYVDQSLAGGEPLVTADPVHGTLIYTSHEGTTHLYQPGLATSSVFPFLTGYRDQVNMWTSKDDGKTWQIVNYQSTGFATDPSHNVGFSDPDLTTDAGGRIYNTGIDLANDALFSSADGGRTWDRGTPQCHNGDRPWLAGGKKDEAFLATNSEDQGHAIFQTTDGGNTCASTGIPDDGTMPGGTSYSGDGKLYYVRDRDMLVEPICLGNGCEKGLGVSTWKRGDAAFTPQGVAYNKPFLAHWPAIALDAADTLYMVWDTDPRKNDGGGCSDTSPTGNGASGSPLPNAIQYAYSTDLGKTWSAPITVAAPSNARAFWPWIAAGDPGKVSIVWYQSDKLVDLDCQQATISLKATTVLGADTGSPSIETVDAVGRPIHDNGVCQGGTTCVVTGQDRRLGDFFTNSIDSRGCVFIASGDTTKPDPVTGGARAIALPIFLRQDSGPALVGGGDCSGETAGLGLPASSSTVGAAGGGNAATGTSGSRRSCVSRRHFRMRLRAPAGERLKSARLFVNGKPVTIRSNGKRLRTLRGRRLTLPVDLRGLPKGSFTVRIEAVTASGKRVVDLRRYRTCTRKPKARS
ncbi:MAG TPA: sialidase family protein [Solirubrobacteraceae bacterium]